tara:strand:- start:3548 stop:3730 length:183 start_codon:yes stop_codon:yes gene_type:complete
MMMCSDLPFCLFLFSKRRQQKQQQRRQEEERSEEEEEEEEHDDGALVRFVRASVRKRTTF